MAKLHTMSHLLSATQRQTYTHTSQPSDGVVGSGADSEVHTRRRAAQGGLPSNTPQLNVIREDSNARVVTSRKGSIRQPSQSFAVSQTLGHKSCYDDRRALLAEVN